MHSDREQIEGDDQLVIGALLGNLCAFDTLVKRFRVAVIMVAEQILHSRSLAEECAQETFLIAFKALPQLQTPAKFGGWLCAIARRRALRIAQSESRAKVVELSELDTLLLAHTPSLTASPYQELERQERESSVRLALQRLPFAYRSVLQLHYMEEWPTTRISAFLSIPVTTVKWRLHQGRHLLRRELITFEENSHHERTQPQQKRDQENDQVIAGHQGDCQRIKPDRKPQRRNKNGSAAVQCHSRPHDTDRGDPSSPLLSPARGSLSG